MKDEEWLSEKLAYIRGLKAPSDQQRLLLLLAEKPDRSPADERKLAALVRAEKAADRAQKARATAARIVNAEKAAERKARNHALYQSAGLMIIAGLVDTKTGKPNRDTEELLGALAWLATINPDEGRRAAWREKGAALLAAASPTQYDSSVPA